MSLALLFVTVFRGLLSLNRYPGSKNQQILFFPKIPFHFPQNSLWLPKWSSRVTLLPESAHSRFGSRWQASPLHLSESQPHKRFSTAKYLQRENLFPGV